MSFEVSYTVEGSILIVRSSGHIGNQQEYKRYFSSMHEKIRETGCNRLLIDSREIQTDFDTIEVYRAASADALAHRANPLERFAILTVPAEAENARFYENVAYNRGLKVKLFYDEEEAWACVRG